MGVQNSIHGLSCSRHSSSHFRFLPLSRIKNITTRLVIGFPTTFPGKTGVGMGKMGEKRSAPTSTGFFSDLRWVICLSSQPADTQPLSGSRIPFIGMHRSPLYAYTYSTTKQMGQRRGERNRSVHFYQSSLTNPPPPRNSPHLPPISPHFAFFLKSQPKLPTPFAPSLTELTFFNCVRGFSPLLHRICQEFHLESQPMGEFCRVRDAFDTRGFSLIL